MTTTTSRISGGRASRPEWVDGRWHLDGRPIHAGDVLELGLVHVDPDETMPWGSRRPVCGYWKPFRVESQFGGRVLVAIYVVGGLKFGLELSALMSPPTPPMWRDLCRVRWPGGDLRP